MGIMMPKKQSNMGESLVPMGLSAAGNAIAPGIGGAAGGALGKQAAAGMEGSDAKPVESDTSAMSRRMSQMDDDPQSVIHQALMHAVELPPEVRAEIGPMLLQAHMKARGYNPMEGMS